MFYKPSLQPFDTQSEFAIIRENIKTLSKKITAFSSAEEGSVKHQKKVILSGVLTSINEAISSFNLAGIQNETHREIHISMLLLCISITILKLPEESLLLLNKERNHKKEYTKTLVQYSGALAGTLTGLSIGPFYVLSFGWGGIIASNFLAEKTISSSADSFAILQNLLKNVLEKMQARGEHVLTKMNNIAFCSRERLTPRRMKTGCVYIFSEGTNFYATVKKAENQLREIQLNVLFSPLELVEIVNNRNVNLVQQKSMLLSFIEADLKAYEAELRPCTQYCALM